MTTIRWISVRVSLVVSAIAAAGTAEAAFPGANGKIAYQRILGASWEIFTMNPDGTLKTQLTSNGAHVHGRPTGRPSCSPVSETEIQKSTE